MKAKKRVALRILLRFIQDNGGGGRMFKLGQSYRWRAPDGRIAAIGWE